MVLASETIVARIETMARSRGDHVALDVRGGPDQARRTLTYGELAAHCTAVARALRAAEIGPGERALVLLPSGGDYVVGLLGCLFARVVAVPVNLTAPGRVARVETKVAAIARDCGARAIVTSAEVARASGEAVARLAATTGAAVITLDATETGGPRLADGPAPDDIAFLQYTSGSTGEPKGVINRHRGLMHNLELLRCLLWPKDGPVVASWLPLYHDMGLIMGVLAPIAFGGRAVTMPPAAFVSDPLAWLEMAASSGAAVLPCPAFALDACVERYDAARLERLDLSGIESVVPAAEPVLPRQIHAFYERFRRHGLRWGAIRPSYGLAEATLFASGSSGEGGPVLLGVEAAGIERGLARPLASETPGARTYVSNGTDFGGQDLRIVDPETHLTLPADHVGEIWMSGPGIAAGYWGQDASTDAVFRARPRDPGADGDYLRTGDLGFLHEGHLYITGRRKDVLIVRGQCHYPNDIEASLAEAHPDIVTGGGAAVSVQDPSGVEALVVIQEVRRHPGLEPQAVAAAIRETVARQHGLSPHDVVLIRRGTLKRTTSGKVQRAAMREAYLRDTLTPLAPRGDEPVGGEAVPAAEDRRAALARLVHDSVVAALGRAAPRRLDPARSLFSLGLDSLAATQAITALEAQLGLSLPDGLLFDHPSIDALADWLLQRERAGTAPKGTRAPTAQGSAEPIAILGLSLRMPSGAADLDTPDAFFDWLMAGGDAVRPLSPERFPPGLDIPGHGACLTRIDGFDAAFFGIGAREAMNTDPQQRLLLEAAWHALEDAGLRPEALRGSDTGAFVGIGTGDYGHLPFASGDSSHFDPYYGTGNAFAAASGRLSFFFDWSGPSLAVDTACSASHAAVHLACQSLRAGESGLALAAGVKLQIVPEIDLVLARAGMLAPDGRCKTFDAAADGYVRGEGVGVVVLKRLSDALRDGDPVRAVIRESALSQDGAGASLSAPNARAQARMLAAALGRARLDPDDIDYVELHGTGTRLGDPIEFQGLAEVFSGRRADDPLLIGSVKTNIGHLEAAAGIAGLIKTVLALQAGRLPPHLHLATVNPAIDLARIPAAVTTTAQDWPRRGDRRRAGVTSFGFAGTIGHLVVEEAPATAALERAGEEPDTHLLLLSARSEDALLALRERYVARLAEPGLKLAPLANGAARLRQHFAEARLAATGRDAAALSAALAQAPVLRPEGRPRLAFLFTGQGSQWGGMGRALHAAEPLFRDAIDRADAALSAHLGLSIRDLMFAAADPRLDETRYTQPALFAFGYALAEVWRGYGIEPDLVLGHSIGEVAALVHAGSLDLEAAARFIARRAALMQGLEEPGGMAALRLSEAEARARLSGTGLSLAAVNGARDVVVAGKRDILAAFAERLAADGISVRPLTVSHAFHSELMEPILDALEADAAALAGGAPRLAVASTLTGHLLEGAPDAAYWRAHARSPVRFADALAAAVSDGCTAFLEIGPQPILTALARREADRPDGLFLASARREDAGLSGLREALAALYGRGFDLNMAAVFRGPALPGSALPLYPFAHRSYWLEDRGGDGRRRPLPKPGGAPADAPLPLTEIVWELIELPTGGSDARPFTLLGGSAALRAQVADALSGAGLATRDSDTIGDGIGLWLGFLEAGQAPADAAIWEFVAFAQQLQRMRAAARIVVPTWGAQGPGPTTAPAQAGIWGAARALAVEYPDLRTLMLDLGSGEGGPVRLATLAPALASLIEREDALAVQGTGWASPRLVPAALPETDGAPIRPDATYLVCGGFGALGLRVVEWLAARGARHLVVTGRGEPGAWGREALERFRLNGIALRHVRVNLADREAMAALLAEIAAGEAPLRGLFHCAGIGRFDTLEAIEADGFHAVMRAKTEGSWHLHALTRANPDIEHFVLFTSISGIWGSRFQIHYGAANAYQDALVGLRQAEGLPALAIAWGPWGGGAGLSEVDEDLLDYLRRAGITRFPPERGLATLDRLAGASGRFVAAEVDWAAFGPLYRAFGRSDLLGRLAPAEPDRDEDDAAAPVWAALTAEERRERIDRFVRLTLAEVLRVPAPTIADEADLLHLGLDSILVMEFAHRCTRRLGLDCTLRAIFENARPARLSAHLAGLADASAEAAGTENAGAVAGTAQADIIVPDRTGRYEPFPLTDLQYAYWVGRDPRFVLGGVSCHAYLESEIAEGFSLARLEAAWNALIARHDALRLVIEPDGRQRILAEVPPYRIAAADLSAAPETEVTAHLAGWREALSHHVLDAGTWPLFELRATHLPGGRTRLHISIDMLINDVTSSQVLWEELGRVYAAGSVEAAGLNPFAISFRDYVLAKARPTPDRAAQLEKDRAYWMGRLGTLPPAPQLPLAPAPARLGPPRFVRHAGRLPAETWQGLRERARGFGVTPATLLIGAFSEVLSAWSDGAAFSLNLTIFDRLPLHPDVPRLVGDFTCVTLLEVDGREEAPFHRRLEALQARMLEDLEHRGVGAVDVLRELNRGRPPEDPLLAPVVFTSQLGMLDPTKGAGTGDPLGEVVHGITQTPQVWLDHQVSELEGQLLYNWDVVEALFPEGLISAMFSAYEALLARLASLEEGWEEAWRQPVGPLLPEAQAATRARVNATAAPLPDETLDGAFFGEAARRPEATALIAGESYSYGRLATWSRRLAGRLHAAGLTPGERVAILMRKGPEQAAACLAVLAGGGVYVPVDPDMPAPRMATILATSAIRLALVQGDVRPDLSGSEAICLVADEAACRDRSEADARPGRAATDEAYVIYTSGSTGVPKGVLIDHRGAMNTIRDVNARFGVGPEDRLFGFSALGFDLSVYDLFGAFAAGAALVLPDAQGSHDPGHWAELVRRHGVTVWNSVPAVFDLLLDEPAESLLSLRLALLSGDWIPLKLPATLAARVPGCRLIALGGATEASIWSNWFPVEAVAPGWRSIPYGWPLANQSYRVLDAQGRDRPDWAVGDLHIGGAGLALGYERDPARTDTAFFVHPRHGRLYRTGDLARYWPDGTLEFLGRRDGQVKIAGHRIELGEIEAALTVHPEIAEAVADATGSEAGQRSLAAWVVLAAPHDGSPALFRTREAEPGSVAANRALAAGLGETVSALGREADRLDAFWDWQRDLAAQCVRDLLSEAGAFSGETGHDTVDLVRRIALAPDFRPLLPRWLALLEATGEVERSGSLWRGRLAAPAWAGLRRRGDDFGVDGAVVDALREAGPGRHAVLAGQGDALALFYGEGAALSPDRLGRLHPRAVAVNRAIGAALGRAAEAARTEGHGLRILEIGARHGLATRDWLGQAGAAEAVITDPSPLLLDTARDLNPGEAAWQVLDPERDPETQGMPAHGFDVLLAFNALHRTRDIGALLRRCRRLLKPGGVLIATEITVNSPLLDVTVALLERGFRDLADARRERGAPLLSGAEWRTALVGAGFTEAAVTAPGEGAGLDLLVARNADAVPVFDQAAAIAHLEARLPAYMVPRRILCLDALPLTANGKVDRKGLPRPDAAGTATPEAAASPATETERQLAAIWSALLPGAGIGRDSNFFTLGGDSLIAVRMAERVRDACGRRLALRDLFAHPVLADLARLLDEAGTPAVAAPEEAAPLAVRPADWHAPFPLTDVQQAYWIGRQALFPLGGVSTHLYVEIDVADLSLDRLERAWNRLIARHGMLRAVIDEAGHQRILDTVPRYHILSADLSAASREEVADWLARQRSELDHRVHDTARWPLFEIRAIRLAAATRLLISLDNLICDGRSMVLLLSEWAALARDPDRALPDLTVSFRDVALHRQAQEASPAFRDSLEHWMRRLPDLPPAPPLPLAAEPAALTPPRFARLAAELGTAEWERLRENIRAAGLSVNAVLLAAYGAALAAAGGGERFVLNLTLFQRPGLHPQIDLLVGDFTSLLLVPFEGARGEGFDAVARRLQQRLWTDLAHAEVSAIRVLREAARRSVDPQAHAAPVVFTSGVGIDNTASDGRTADWLGTFTGGLTQTPQVWIDHQVVEREGRLVFNWDHVEGLFDPAWIAAAFTGYCGLLHRLAADRAAWADPLAELVTDIPVSNIPAPDSLMPEAAVPEHSPANGASGLPSDADAAADSALTAIIAAALARELGLDRVDPDRNVFELGATSLSLIRVHQRLRRELGRDFPVVAMFGHPTCRALARHLAPEGPPEAATAEADAMARRLAARGLNARRRQAALR
ncbi:amino acid adenylation domain-containing protein [Methylorubrum populi]